MRALNRYSSFKYSINHEIVKSRLFSVVNSNESNEGPTTSKIGGRKPRIKTNENMRWDIKPIGIVESPYEEKFGTPKQATIGLNNSKLDGKLVLYDEYRECISELDGFDYIWVLSLMHLNSGYKKRIRPQPVPDCENKPPDSVGLFASRAPHRPNPIALSAMQVISIDIPNGIIHVHGLDLLNDTPILDIKPYIPAFDAFPEAKAGWMDLIRSNPHISRVAGYQQIHSPRGARAARAEEKKNRENRTINDYNNETSQ
eukprot:gene6945-9499_t